MSCVTSPGYDYNNTFLHILLEQYDLEFLI